MATLKYLSQYFSTTLNVGGGIDASQTTGIILQSVSGVHDITEPGQICVTYSDPIDTSVAEWIDYTSINGSNELVGAVRGREGFSAHTHLQNATVAFILSASHHNDVVNAVKKVYNETTDTLLKASAAEVVTGTDDAKIVTPLAAAPYGNSSMSRQAIINGNFDVWQRGTTYTGIATGSFLTDRFSLSHSADSGTFPTHINRRTAITAGEIPNSFYSYELNVNGAGTSLGAGSYYWIRQKIENGVRHLCGDGKKVTLSFWAKSDIANKRLGVHMRQDYGTGGSPTTAEVINGTNWTLTSTWTKYTHTFTTNTLSGKTFGTGDNDIIDLQFMYVWAATYKDRAGATTDESFVGAGSIFIAQIQLCAGDVALPFQPKSFAQELQDCKRYCVGITVSGYEAFGSGNGATTTTAYIQIPFYCEMRTNPTLVGTAADYRLFDSAGTGYDLTVLAIEAGTKSKYVGAVIATVASGLTAFKPYFIGGDNGGTRTLYFDAEL